MSASTVTQAESARKGDSTKSLAMWLVIVTATLAAGFATPLLIARLVSSEEPKPAAQVVQVSSLDEIEFIDVPEIIAVLGKTRFSRYVKLNISLQVNKKDRAKTEKLLLAREAVIRDRILAHVSELTEEELAGRHGNSQLRRRIHHIFNESLFADGIERIQDVLFRDFQTQ